MAALPNASTIPTVKLVINGEQRESHAAQWRDIVNPATQQVLARVPMWRG
jgi:malonate-semialdehyde dehydrogenase (acetylating)/methylmalonate-semialdehyde dehydrogenase